MMPMIKVRRVYEAPRPSDGLRVLVDRMWPRGLSKRAVRADLWLKEIAPSATLRKWFAHDSEKWPEFTKRYREELTSKPELVSTLLKRAEKEDVTLLFAARDETCNNAVALRNYLEEQRRR
jgi:uncharacterized protein YeaO (DUF488 family)